MTAAHEHIWQYDTAGVVRIRLNEAVYTITDAADLARYLPTLAAYDAGAADVAAAYALALVARHWAGRPSQVQRGAVIQAAETLRQAVPVLPAGGALASTERAVDDALIAGGDGEQAALAQAATHAQQYTRAAERCGRRAAALLTDDDTVLLAGPGLAGAAMLREAAALRLFLAETSTGATLAVCGAAFVARDGSTLLAAHTMQAAHAARAARLPVYLLCPHGPDAATDALPGGLPPEAISAIVTSRGIYRPEMIARHLNDGDAPLDVIALS